MKKSFSLHLQSADRYERIDGVRSFVGQDASRASASWPGTATSSTILDYGLARFLLPGERWQYVASPGAVLSFGGDQLYFSTRRYLRDDDYGRVSELLSGQLADEERSLKAVKDHLQRLEQELFVACMNSSGDAHERREVAQPGRARRRPAQAGRARSAFLAGANGFYLGTLSVLFLLPLIGGAYLGRWLDGLNEAIRCAGRSI